MDATVGLQSPVKSACLLLEKRVGAGAIDGHVEALVFVIIGIRALGDGGPRALPGELTSIMASYQSCTSRLGHQWGSARLPGQLWEGPPLGAMPDLPACAFVVPHLARSSRPERRLELYRDGAFYVLIGWKVAARLICQNEHVAPLASVAYPLIECRQVLGKRSFEVRVVLPARLISDRFFASRSMNVGDTKRLFPLDAPASICRPVPALIDAVQFVMPPPQILRPPGLDERQYRDEVLIGQAPAEGGHPCLVIFQVGRLDHAALRDVEQEPIRMMPGMAALVMRPGRKEALLVGGLPIRLAFKVPAMARGAMLEIDSLAARNEFSIIGAKQRRGIPDQQQISADDRRSGRNHTSARGAILVIVGGRPSPARVNGKPLQVVQPSQAVSQTPGLAEFERGWHQPAREGGTAVVLSR